MPISDLTTITGVADARPFSVTDFELRAKSALSLDHPPSAFDPDWVPERGDHNLAPMIAPTDGRLHRRAAVLVPIVAHDAEATILLTRRSAHLRDHSGQIAFPGGKIDETDADALAAALREAEEEIGLDRGFIRPLGYLDPYLSGTGFRILPVVALVQPGFTLTPDPREVEITFEVPLSFLMSVRNHQRHSREHQGTTRWYYAMPYADHYIWGVTAGILRNLYDRLYAP